MSLTLQESARLAGGHCWVERRLFELLGAWAGHVPAVPAKLALDRHAQHAAWRADQWWDRLPVTAGVDRHALVVPPAGWAAFAAGREGAGGLDDASGVEGAGGVGGAGGQGAGMVAVAYRVLFPRLVVGYRRHLEAATAVSDGPAIRTLHQVLADAGADWQEGEAVVQELIEDAAAVHSILARAEAVWVASRP